MFRKRRATNFRSPIEHENSRSGDDGWWVAPAPAGSIEGYASAAGVRQGERLELFVSTEPEALYKISAYRLGWYGGRGGRLMVGMGDAEARRGAPQPMPRPDPETGLVAAGWVATDVIQVGEEWPSGQYVAVLTLPEGQFAGRGAFIPFVVRRSVGAAPAAGLVQMPTNTAQAYNNWGGKSLYTSNSTDGIAATKVSYDRPYPAFDAANLNARWPFVWDLPLLRFLERHGFDVEYTTDTDTHRDPKELLEHNLVILSGHDEYWSVEMRDGFDEAQRRGINLACMGANTAYWNVRYEDRERTIVEYRHGHLDPEQDRARKTVRFRDLHPARPEHHILGVQYEGGLATEADAPRDFSLTTEGANHRWVRGTGLEAGVALSGLVGYEWDAAAPGDPDQATVLFHLEDELSNADALTFRAASGALVFSAGSLQFPWALDSWGGHGRTNRSVEAMMRNAMNDLVVDRRIDAQTADARATTSGRIPPLPGVVVEASASAVAAAHAAAMTRMQTGVSRVTHPEDASHAADPEDYFRLGRSIAFVLTRALGAVGVGDPERMLDLTCGWGRVTRALRAAWPEADLYAAEASAECVAFCAAEFSAVPVRMTDVTAVHELPADHFDVIWCGTLLSSVPPDMLGPVANALLGRLRSNGLLVGAFHGRDSANRFTEGSHEPLRVLGQHAKQNGEAYVPDESHEGRGIAAYRPERLVQRLTTHSDSMVVLLAERAWADHLDIVAVARTAVHHPQGSLLIA